MSLHTSGSQTVGPYFRIGLEPMFIPNVAAPETPGEHVVIRGRVFDGDRQPVPDAMLETWQADAAGVYPSFDDAQSAEEANFRGFGRVPTDEQGQFSLSTIKPGRVAGPGDSLQAPHLVALVYMRGLLIHLVTRMYFPDESSNADDAVLQLVPAERRHTLIAHRPSAEDNLPANTLLWDIHLQGDDETVFFDA